jgi:hypothetical protein
MVDKRSKSFLCNIVFLCRRGQAVNRSD